MKDNPEANQVVPYRGEGREKAVSVNGLCLIVLTLELCNFLHIVK